MTLLEQFKDKVLNTKVFGEMGGFIVLCTNGNAKYYRDIIQK